LYQSNHKYLNELQEELIMRLNEIAEDLRQRLTKKNNAETAKQKAAYAKSAQAWYQLQKAQAEEVKARQKFIQAAVAASNSYHRDNRR
jgi:hypothetical protein